jgi:hypothetical protein
MKHLIGIGLLLAAAACGGGGGKCASSYSGVWIGTTTTDQISLSDSCDFQYQGAGGCRSAGTYAAPLGSQGSVLVVIQSSTGGNCLAVGSYSCSYSASATTLTFNCGAGAFNYRR